ncbi:MAG: hypothetical protein IT370_07360 [Deltaproteobacteria bacterium]|nr:hypothetical protein [Deltaproteobacteria bacterium]
MPRPSRLPAFIPRAATALATTVAMVATLVAARPAQARRRQPEPRLQHLHVSSGRFETWASHDGDGELRLDSFGTLGNFVLPLQRGAAYRPDDVTSIAISCFDFHKVDLGNDRESAALRFYGAELRVDRPWWGLAAGGHLVGMTPGDDFQLLTPSAGLRLGRVDRLLLALHASSTSMYALAWHGRPRSLSADHELALTASVPLTRNFHLQLRARRNVSSADQRTLRETSVAIGLEGALSIGLRAFPVFAGIGTRRVEADQDLRYDSRLGGLGVVDVTPPGDQLLFVFGFDFGVHATSTVY